MNAKVPTTLHGECGPPPHFAGRHAELSLMQRRLDAVLTARNPKADGLLLFTGIPGIGKTHLAYHFVQQQKAARNVKAVLVGAEELAYPEGMVLRIGRTMGAEDAFAKAAGIGGKVSGARASVAGVVTAGVTVDPAKPTLGFTQMLGATATLRAWRNKALVLVIDEVQNTNESGAEQLRALHQGLHECPILTIAAGLQHSKSVLSERGISRASHHSLGLLSTDESVEAVYHGLANLGTPASESTAKTLADAAMRFPQHIHGYIEAARLVHDARGEIDSPDAIAEALKIGAKSREEYYVGRMGAMGDAAKLYRLVEDMATRNADAVTRPTAESIVGANVVDAAIRHGVLSSQEDGVLSFGIPSFRNYMIRRAAAYREVSQAETQGKTSTR